MTGDTSFHADSIKQMVKSFASPCFCKALNIQILLWVLCGCHSTSPAWGLAGWGLSALSLCIRPLPRGKRRPHPSDEYIKSNKVLSGAEGTGSIPGQGTNRMAGEKKREIVVTQRYNGQPASKPTCPRIQVVPV